MRDGVEAPRIIVFMAALIALLMASSAPDAGAAKPITGKLSKRGYTVIAVAKSGQAETARARRGNFRIRRPAKVVTLHLRTPAGTFGGPIVVDTERRGKRAILGVMAGASLGKVIVKGRKGYANLKGQLDPSFVNSARIARAKKGVPIGAGKFGRVSSMKARGGAPGDSDLDGIPESLDIDDDGDLVLDSNDASSSLAASSAIDPATIPPPFTRYSRPLEGTVNANAAAATDQQIDAALSSSSDLLLTILPGDSAELDCGGSANPSPPPPLVGGLIYCSWGGTGRIGRYPPVSNERPFPDCCDPDGDGFGTLTPDPGIPQGGMTIHHGATSAQIGTGDVVIQRVTTAGVEEQFPSAVRFVFATVPALVAYNDTAGNSAAVSYPASPGAPGTMGNGFPVDAGPGGDVVVTLTTWRPQRRPIPPEAGDWIDIGGLTHGLIVQHVGPLPGGTTVQQPCPQSAYSTSDPELGPVSPQVPSPGFTDLAPDRLANPTETLSYTVNLSQCLASLGVTWNPGEEASVLFGARVSRPDGPDNTSQSAWLELQ